MAESRVLDGGMLSLRATLSGYALSEVEKVEVGSMPLPCRSNEKPLDVGEPPSNCSVNLDNF